MYKHNLQLHFTLDEVREQFCSTLPLTHMSTLVEHFTLDEVRERFCSTLPLTHTSTLAELM